MYQLFFYREGRRKSPEMNTVAKRHDRRRPDGAIRVSSPACRRRRRLRGPIDEARYRRGAELAQQRMCGTCHNPDYSGREQMPRLAGQHEAYLLKSFKEYQAGARIGTQAAMAEAVRGLDDAALADLAHYLAHYRP